MVDLVMAKERGKRTKKILHIFHLLIEFLRYIFSSVTKPIMAANFISPKAVKGLSKKSGKTASKTVSKTALAGTGSALGSSSILSGLTAGTVISVKTAATLLVIGGLFFGGLGTYGYITHENPLNLIGNLFKVHNTPNLPSNPPQTSTPSTNSNPTTQSSGQSLGQSSHTVSTTPQGYSYSASQNSQNPNLQSSNTSENSSYDNGTIPPSINYTVPEDPDNLKSTKLDNLTVSDLFVTIITLMGE